jgi:hypothetical protein
MNLTKTLRYAVGKKEDSPYDKIKKMKFDRKVVKIDD